MKKTALLIISGVLWTALAYSLGVTRHEIGIPVFCGIATSLFLGFILLDQIQKNKGWRWFLLPLQSIILGTLLFVYLLQAAWWIRETVTKDVSGYSHISGYWMNPIVYAFYAITAFIWITYPASLLTHYALRKYAHQKNA